MTAPTTADGRVPTPMGADWTRKYPPLLSIVVALVIALLVLPSALNVPQTNPTQTLEYAPVPPKDDEPPPPPQGNLSSLGFAGSATVEGPGAEGGNTAVTIPPLTGKNPTSKRCVGSPPRQTEDNIAPPCVAYFKGDNFGATYQGVTKDEIRLLIYYDGDFRDIGSSKGEEPRPQNAYFDLFKPPKPGEDEHVIVKGYRAWQRYFNDRFQTYDRVVHFYMYFTGSDHSPEARRADAADNFVNVKPFAVLSNAGENEVDYVEAMAKKGVLNFGSFTGKERSFFARFPKLIWGYSASLEQQADLYSTYICTKVVNKPVVMSGNQGENGKARKYGYIATSDDNYPGYIRLAELVRSSVEKCGVEFATEATFPRCCFQQDNSTTPDYATAAMADFKQKGITTILWPGGVEGNMARSAQLANYFPEWMILGDATWAGNISVNLAGASTAFDEHALTVTSVTFEPAEQQQRCYQAIREVDTTSPEPDAAYTCGAYRNLFQFFTGVQVAGPRLGPTSIDKGFHAIPAIASKDPQTPACFYEPGDYTCVKDAMVETWDAQGQPPGDNRPGCWRGVQGGLRYLTGRWPAGNVDAQWNEPRPCNGREGGWTIDPA